jgi:hypothetical protein
MSENRLKIKNIDIGFIQIGAAKSHQRFVKLATDGRFSRFPKIFDRTTMTFGCTDFYFYFESSFTSSDLDDQINTIQGCHKNNVNDLRIC